MTAFLISYAVAFMAIGFVLGCEFYRLWLRRLHKISVQIRKAQRGGK